ncbi:MAG: sigma-54-dependent transcriptional regulator [Opitutales bacterium]
MSAQNESEFGQSMSTESTPTVLVVDDNQADLVLVSTICEALGCAVDRASDGFSALKMYEERRHHLVLTDYAMEPMNGIYLVSRIKEINPDAVCLIVSGFPNSTLRRFAEQSHIIDLIIKPIQSAHLQESIRRALARSIVAGGQASGIALSDRMDDCEPLAGNSSQVQALRANIAARIDSPKPLLLTGPHASGKRTIARFMHSHGPNAGKPVIEISCANMGEKSLRYDLIGEGGQWQSILRQAEGGTLILDQIHSLPISVQRDLAGQFDTICSKMHLITLSDISLDEALSREEIDPAFYLKVTAEHVEVPGTSAALLQHSGNPARQNPPA